MSIVFIRAIILYIIVIISVRVMGKRQIGELQPSELVITILVKKPSGTPNKFAENNPENCLTDLFLTSSLFVAIKWRILKISQLIILNG